MTREELQKLVDDNPWYNGMACGIGLCRILTHDAEQRAEIARLEEWKRIVLGTGTDQEAVIRMAAAEYTQAAIRCWKDKCEHQAQEIARLREALKGAMNLIDVDNLTTQTVYRNCQQALKESTP